MDISHLTISQHVPPPPPSTIRDGLGEIMNNLEAAASTAAYAREDTEDRAAIAACNQEIDLAWACTVRIQHMLDEDEAQAMRAFAAIID